MDRLGATGVNKQVLLYLKPRAEAAGQARKKAFEGWFHVAAKELVQARAEPRIPVIASPITEPEPDANLYHAHVVRPEWQNNHLMSLQLRHIFTRYGEIERNEQIQPTQNDRLIAWLSEARAWAKGMLARILRLRRAAK